ncbi:PREDICTED: uncharacterized protein LOC108610827 [Drosophila arizonae]|uniref:Uncharacterized protein LOC108610827 n=1 Tax=Drosophila arizonae TaxID=7263 RepID=A0ABM1NUM8_DROAR|nr:PREDICTED: uncharacterized protein LOC108610827 [Drosophila arizonae]
MPIYCSPSCSQPVSQILRLLNCERETESAKKCKRLSPVWNSEERRWCLHNGSMLRKLVGIVRKPLHQVCSFMFELTMKKFGEITNPKCSRWTYCRVPLVRPDTCALYDGIYDRQGNLRPVFHPYILHLVVAILRHYLNLPCAVEKPPSKRPEYEMFVSRKGTTCKDFFKPRRKRGKRFGRGGRGGKGGSGGGAGGGGGGGGGGEGDDDDDDGFDDDDLADLNDFLNNSTFGDEFGDGRGGDDKDGKGRGGKGGKGGKGQGGDSDSDDDDDDGVGDDGAKMKKNIADISDLYSSIVETKRMVKKKPKPPKRRPFRGAGRQYMGVILPVLMHEPFDDTKPWTWIRRHPIQERVLEGTTLGRAKIHKYKRETLEVQYIKARQRNSVRSLYGVKDHPSIISYDLFGKGERPKKAPPLVKPFNYKKLLERNDVANMSRRNKSQIKAGQKAK